MTEQQLNDVWTYEQSEHTTTVAILDSEGFDVGYVRGAGLDPKESAERLAWRIVADHNLNLMAMTAPAVQGEQIAWATRLYNTAYHAGHDDTVEGDYTHVYPQDMDSHHEDVVQEWLADNPQPAAQREPLRHPATPSFLEYPSFDESANFDPVPAAQGEPVAWQRKDKPERIITKLPRRTMAEVDRGVEFIPLYAAPQPAEQQPTISDEIQARTTFGGPQRFTTADQQETDHDNQ